MKVKDIYIKKLSNEFQIEFALARSIYEIIFKRDWGLFIADIADFYNPMEVAGVKKIFNQDKENFDQELVDKIDRYMKNDSEYRLHSMEQEV